MIFIFAPLIFGEISKASMNNLIQDSVNFFMQSQKEFLKMYNPFLNVLQKQS